MHDRKSNSALLRASCCVVLASVATLPATAQTAIPAVSGPPVQQLGDTLLDALTCRLADTALPALMPQLRQQRPDDFNQSYRQYSTPMMDLYRLRNPVGAWGHVSDSVLVSENRVMIAVEGAMEAVSAKLESTLQSSAWPLGGALDEAHALVVMHAGQPGLEGMVLLGCEYRIEGLSLLEGPAAASRVHGTDKPVVSNTEPSGP